MIEMKTLSYTFTENRDESYSQQSSSKQKDFYKNCNVDLVNPYLPTPPLGQDMTQGQFLSGV